MGTTGGGGNPGGVGGLQQHLGVRDGNETGRVGRPVDSVDDAGGIGCNLKQRQWADFLAQPHKWDLHNKQLPISRIFEDLQMNNCVIYN